MRPNIRTVTYPIITARSEGDVDVSKEEVIEVSVRSRVEDGSVIERLLFKSVNLLDKVDPSWYPLFIQRGLRLNELTRSIFMKAYQNGLGVRPLSEDIFNVFSMPLSKVRVVIVGQDPYPGWDHESKQPKACGYAFATNAKETPGSLQRIRNAIVNTCGQITITDKANPNSLKGWRDQGVLLLNNTPIVLVQSYTGTEADEQDISARVRSILAFPKKAWAGITATVCKEISQANPNCHFILLGKETEYLSRVVSKFTCGPHPSMRSDLEFSGKCFSDAGEVDWTKM
jgi:uracil DNA glycosylase